MGLGIRILLLILASIASLSVTAAEPLKLAIGQPLEELKLPASKGYGFSLREQLGKPVMLIWVGDCTLCAPALERYKELADRYSRFDLVTRVIVDVEDNAAGNTPELALPVLMYSSSLPSAWSVEPTPSVMLINPDGVLDYVFVGNLNRNLEFTNRALSSWLQRVGVALQR